MRIFLGDGVKFHVSVDLNLPFIFVANRVMVNAVQIKFPPSKIAFEASHIRMEYYGIIKLDGGHILEGMSAIIEPGCLVIRMLR